MKKLALALVCLVSVAFFASCDPKEVENPEPSIVVMTGADFISGTIDNPQTISLFDTTNWRIGIKVASNAETGKELKELKLSYEITSEGEEPYTDDTIIDLTGKTSYEYTEYIFEQKMTIAEFVLKATVTDVDNQVNTADIAFKIDLPATPLEETEITWERKGSSLLNETAAEMAAVGLMWDKRGNFVNIHTINGSTLFVIKDAAEDYKSVTTDLEMLAYFMDLTENAEAVDEYREISVDAASDKEYNDLLAVMDGEGELHFVLFERAKVQIDLDAQHGYGIWTTINGRVK